MYNISVEAVAANRGAGQQRSELDKERISLLLRAALVSVLIKALRCHNISHISVEWIFALVMYEL